jgi:SAM-dependent methyltransferase
VSDVLSDRIPDDWYATAIDAASAEMAWTDRTGPEVDRVAKTLQPQGGERVLDMACGSGRHLLELRRRGFSVVGADISPDLIEIARRDAAGEDLDVDFALSDLRDLDFDPEFDLVLNLNDGAIGYLESDEENLRTFEAISRAPRPGGRNLVQPPNVLYVKERLPQRSWIPAPDMIELVEFRWDTKDSAWKGDGRRPLRRGPGGSPGGSSSDSVSTGSRRSARSTPRSAWTSSPSTTAAASARAEGGAVEMFVEARKAG